MALFRARSSAVCRQFLSVSRIVCAQRGLQTTEHKLSEEPSTHTGQKFAEDDYRTARFQDKEKLVNTRFAIDLIAEDPVVVCEQRVVSSSSGGALGHPKVYINLDPPGVHTCGYSGRKFVHKKYYDQSTMGPSISFSQYLEQTKS